MIADRWHRMPCSTDPLQTRARAAIAPPTPGETRVRYQVICQTGVRVLGNGSGMRARIPSTGNRTRAPGIGHPQNAGADSRRCGNAGADSGHRSHAGADSRRTRNAGADSGRLRNAGSDSRRLGNAGADYGRCGNTGLDSRRLGNAGSRPVHPGAFFALKRPRREPGMHGWT